jgi:hypothetical protein
MCHLSPGHAHHRPDDPTKYRSEEEVKAWEQKDPLTRFRVYLEKKKLFDPSVDEQVDEEIARGVSASRPCRPLIRWRCSITRMPSLPPHVAAERAEVAARLQGSGR